MAQTRKYGTRASRVTRPRRSSVSTTDPSVVLRARRAIGWAPCTMDASASYMCDSTTTSFQLVNKDDNCVIVQSVQHAAMYPHRIAIARMITRRTQHHPLSAPSDHPSHGYAMRVHGSMLQVIGVRKPVSRLPRGDCSDQHCCPERAWCAVALSYRVQYLAS